MVDELRDFDPTKELGGGTCQGCGLDMPPWRYADRCQGCEWDDRACPTCAGRGWHTAGGNDPMACGRCPAGEMWDAAASRDKDANDA